MLLLINYSINYYTIVVLVIPIVNTLLPVILNTKYCALVYNTKYYNDLSIIYN